MVTLTGDTVGENLTKLYLAAMDQASTFFHIPESCIKVKISNAVPVTQDTSDYFEISIDVRYFEASYTAQESHSWIQEQEHQGKYNMPKFYYICEHCGSLKE